MSSDLSSTKHTILKQRRDMALVRRAGLYLVMRNLIFETSDVHKFKSACAVAEYVEGIAFPPLDSL